MWPAENRRRSDRGALRYRALPNEWALVLQALGPEKEDLVQALVVC